ncbi:MAG: Asp-tRNA(Asn)/Glu-tRNA(Gln) amidotransferase subunit GatA [Deltaproteobacteria bacterium]|nr:MAG: Asp-tRNA(Asn)/Glu-tRNA(Gln) amidotransferase subunit GatA [Deltaproteobacteria bacterium]
MSQGPIHEWTLLEAARKVREKEISSRELTAALLARIDRLDPKVNSYVTVLPDRAASQAAACDEEQANGSLRGPLHGVPVGMKDIFCTRGVRTTCGSRILHNFDPPYDAAVAEKVLAAGAVLLGKHNMDEFAMGSSTETSHFGPSRNPWDLSRIPGGSSGGTAAAVSAGMCFAGVGTDTGGSIRQPASLCGVVGMKPTYGRVSRYGMIAFASSLDQAGPITRTVADAAALLGVIAGYDRRDSTCVDVPVPDYLAAASRPVAGLRVGLPKEYFEGGGLSPEVKDAVARALAALTGQGATVVEVSLPHTEFALSAYYLIAPAEASSNLARYDGVRYGHRAEGASGLVEMMSRTRAEGFGPEVKRRVMIGTYALSAGYYEAFYGKAQKVRTLIRRDFDAAFSKADVLLTPTAPTPAFRLGEKTDDPLTMYLSDIFTIPCNLAGIPGISVPCGLSAEGLPIGAQLLSNHFREETLFSAAGAVERAIDFPRVAPFEG